MKAYGANRATEFSKKQISVIYSKAKNGELKVEKWYMSRLYDLAEYYGYDYNRSVEFEERSILKIIENVFSNNIEEAQKMIDFQTEDVLKLLSKKYRESADRSFV